MPLSRRKFIKSAMLLPVISIGGTSLFETDQNIGSSSALRKRVRPGDPRWPSVDKWKQLARAVNGRLIKLESPFASCKISPVEGNCEQLFKNLKNPYYISDNPALMQTTGWYNAWQSEASVYAVAAENTNDVVAAVMMSPSPKNRYGVLQTIQNRQ